MTKRSVSYVDGQTLVGKMTELGLVESTLAQRAGVSEQTVRNYGNSNSEKPWPANTTTFHRVCEVLGLPPDKMQLEMEVDEPGSDRGALADQRFLGEPDKVRSISGTWKAHSIDLEIPNHITYSSPIPWNGVLMIKQTGNQFEAKGTDKDDDGVFARGTLLECGNWIRFDYWIENPLLREYGAALVEYKGDGRTIEGFFLGRDAGQSNIGMILAKLTLTRIAETPQGQTSCE